MGMGGGHPLKEVEIVNWITQTVKTVTNLKF